MFNTTKFFAFFSPPFYLYSMRSLLFLYLFVIITQVQAQNSPLLAELLAGNTDPRFRQVMDNPEKYRVQIIYTRIDRDQDNVPHFTHHTFQTGTPSYFNPASTVKLPAAILTLEKLHDLPGGITRDTWLQVDSAFRGQRPLVQEASAPGQKPTLAHLIRQAMLVSENEAYNRLYQFVGQEYLNKRLWQLGHKQVRITRRFEPNDEEQNRRSNPFRFLREDGSLLYAQPQEVSAIPFEYPQLPLIGEAHYSNGTLVPKGMDFSRANNLPLFDLQQILQRLMFPMSFSAEQRYRLKEEDYRFLYRYLSQSPGETNYPKYDEKDFYPSYAKFFFRDSTVPKQPPGLRIFNKVGWAYGFLTDASYVVDFDHQAEYMLAATIYVNEDGVLNDGKYDYKELGYPFLYELGQTIYRHELSRERPHKPDLSRFKIDYEQRIDDKRPTLKESEVDN